MLKTKFSSYCLNGLPIGCKLCVKGKKLVVFITGICQRNCYYCSLSSKRKNIDSVWVNERQCKSIREMIEEAKESNATSAGITGGDPFLKLNKTIKFAKALKRAFGKSFHIHIYLPTKFLTKNKLKKLSKHVNEVRLHPEFLARKLTKKEKEKEFRKEIEKIKLASLFWKKQNIGIELPMLPDKKQEIFDFILKIKNYISFVNLNELEISDTNFNYITKNYKLKKGGYVVSGSKEAGLWLLQELSFLRKKRNFGKKRTTNAQKPNIKLKIHLCTAETKNWFQYKNRLKRHKILPYGYKTKDGTVLYFAVYTKNEKEFKKLIKELRKELKEKKTFRKICIDKRKKRILLSEKAAKELINKYKIIKVEEFPTYDGMEVEREEI